ncbi:MAG: DUF4139 domain-containing protein [Bacteroidia bacterium]|nr:DUF4139 domain-containing protein [Bacteroidia bacterium]
MDKEKKLGLDYIIDEPYTILADGKNYLLEIKRQDQEVNYTYHAIPKLDKEVFLVAEFTNWRELDLLSGDLNIFYDNTYLGKSKILAEQIIDTLELSVARDRDIQVKRESKKELNDKRFVGSNVKESLAYEITVKNNKRTKISMVLNDQVPVSEYKSVFVELNETADAEHDEKTGVLTWKFDLEPGETKIVKYDFSIKYPKALSYRAN